MIGWQGDAFFGDGWFAFRGMAADNEPHAHAAIQLVAASKHEVVMEAPDGRTIAGQGWVIPPGLRHRLLPSGQLTLVLLEPDHSAAAMLLDGVDRSAIEPLSNDLIACLTRPCELASLFDGLFSDQAKDTLDARLSTALSLLGHNPGGLGVISEAVGLSEVRLRSLARQELGVPMSKIGILKKVVKAAEAIAGGASLSEAAIDAGFSDQAHLTRAFKQVIGLTPGEAAKPLRPDQER